MKKRKGVNVNSPHMVSDNTISNDNDKLEGDSLPIGRLYSRYIDVRFRECIKNRDFYSPEVILYLLRLMPNPFTTDDIKKEEMRFMTNILFVPKIKRYWKNIHKLEDMGIFRLERKGKKTNIFFNVS